MSYKDKAQQRGTEVDQSDDERLKNELLPCRFCNAPTKRWQLTEQGARCGGCFASYMRGLPDYPRVPDSAVPKNAGQKAWAHKLKWREENGGLPQLQRAMWRKVLVEQEEVA